MVFIIQVACKQDKIVEDLSKIERIVVSSPKTNILFDGSETNYKLTAKAYSSNGNLITDIKFDWQSSNTTVASVNQDGLVTILGGGSTNISATFEGITDDVDINVVTPFEGGNTLFKNVSVVDVESGTVIEAQNVLVHNDKIVEIGSSSTSIPDNTKVIDGMGKYLMPGITDAHVHVVLQSDFIKYLYNGITSVIDMGFPSTRSDPPPVLDWKREIIAGVIDGPNYYPSIMIRGPQDNGRVVVSNSNEARIAVDSHKDFDFIKAYSLVPRDAFLALADEGKKYKLSVIGHGNRNMGLQSILESGQVMIAHAEEYLYTFYSGIQPDRTQEAINLTLNAGAYVTATLSTYEAISKVWGQNNAGYSELLQRPGYEYLDQSYKTRWENQYLNVFNQPGSLHQNLVFQREFVKEFNDAGIPLLLGTDSPGIVGQHAGFSIHEEIRNLSEAGLDNTSILKIATMNFGDFVKQHSRYDEDFGQVKINYRSDLILLSNNPLEDLNTLKHPLGVMVRGKWYGESTLQSLLDELKK